MHLPQTPRERVRFAVIAIVAALGFWFVAHQFESLDLEELLRDVSNTLGEWTYLLAGVLAFLETGAFVGLVVPGETFVILAGAVAGQGATDIYLTIAIVWFSAWAGDTTSFFIGRRLGRGFILRHGPRVRITAERFRQVEDYFRSHGGKTILVGRFIGLVRALAPFIAGSSGMEYRAFVPYGVLGTGLWAATFSVLGYVGSRNIERIADVAGRGVFVFGLIVGTIVAVVVAMRFLREPRNRAMTVAWIERRAVLRPAVALGRRVQPQARFLWNRLTPGELGLELTAMLAVLSVAVFIVVGYAATVTGDPGPTPSDRAAFDVAGELTSGAMTDVAKAITALGSGGVTLAVGLVAAVVLAVRRHWAELAVLVAAMVILALAVPVMKEVVDRPRPGEGLVGHSGQAYPSGHAAYSVLYAWLALTAAVLWRPGRTHVSALAVAGVVIAAAVGLSRVYLHVHYLSDVAGGWALGVSAFTACSAVALVVVHLRDNSSP